MSNVKQYLKHNKTSLLPSILINDLSFRLIKYLGHIIYKHTHTCYWHK